MRWSGWKPKWFEKLWIKLRNIIMQAKTIRWIITTTALIVATAHFIWPRFSFDTTYIILLVIAVMPWLAPIIKSIELPGGFKIEVNDIRNAANKVTDTGALKSGTFAKEAQPSINVPESADELATVRRLASTDPNLALVG